MDAEAKIALHAYLMAMNDVMIHNAVKHVWSRYPDVTKRVLAQQVQRSLATMNTSVHVIELIIDNADYFNRDWFNDEQT